MTIIFEFTIGHLKCLPFTETCITVSSMILQLFTATRFRLVKGFSNESWHREPVYVLSLRKKQNETNKQNQFRCSLFPKTNLVSSSPKSYWCISLHTRSFVHRYVKLSLNEEQQKHCHLLDECGFAVSQQTIPTINSTETTETLHLQAILIIGYKRKKKQSLSWFTVGNTPMAYH